MECRAIEFPFKCVLSLTPLIEFWDQNLLDGDFVKAAVAKKIREELKFSSVDELIERSKTKSGGR